MGGPLGLALGLMLAVHTSAQDHAVLFDTEAPGEPDKGLDLWGLDTAWLWDANVIRGVNFMGKPQTDLIRFSFTGDTPVVNGDLTGAGLAEFDERMAIVNAYTDSHTALYLNNDTENWDGNPYLAGGGVDPYLWAELIAVTAQKCMNAGRRVLSVAPFNEPDYSTWQGNVTRFGDVSWQLRWSGAFPAFNYSASDFIRIYGGNTLNNDVAASWYDQLNTWGFVEEGNTHQLAGGFDTYAAFYQTVQANSDIGTNDELHNVMEAMVGAQYGMDVGIWWGTAERARGEFVKASDGMRLAYAENRPNWTAASVYRAPDGKVQAFVGESERQARVTTYRFVSKTRPVFYDGHGPQRAFDVTTTGGSGYQTSNHSNAERVLNITWGEDVQPAIGGRYFLVNRRSRNVMEVDGASTENGANIGQSAFNGSLNQQWDVNPVPRNIGGDNSYFAVKNANSEKAPDVFNFSLEDGGNIAQWQTGTHPGPNQQWFMEYVEDGWFRIGSRWSGLYLSTDGANVVQQSPGEHYEQQWRLVPAGADPTDFKAPARPLLVWANADAVSTRVSWLPNAEKELTYTVMRSTTSGGPYEIVARGLTSTSFVDGSASQSIPYYYRVQAVDASLNRSQKSYQVRATPTGAPSLVAQYGFQCDATDGSGHENNGALEGSARFISGGDNGTCLLLDGGYVSLPAEVAHHDQVTIAAWVYWSGGAAWQRIFDFGNGTEEYLFLSPRSGGGTLRLAIKDGGPEQLIEAPALAEGQWSHVAITLDGQSARLYVNGIEAASAAATMKAFDFNPVLNYIGKSQFSADPLFRGAIDDFRIYNHALGAAEVAALAANSITPPAEAPVGLENADFEAGVANFPDGFDADPDIPGWMDYNVTDSGVEGGNAWWGTYDGSYSAFMAPGNGAYLLSGYTIRPGDAFTLGFVAKSWQGGSSQWTATLFYDSPANVIGSYTAATAGEWTEYSSPTISATAGSVGGVLGVLFVNTGEQFANLDDVWLTKTGSTIPPVVVTAHPSTLRLPLHDLREVEISVSGCAGCIAPGCLNVTCFVSSSEPDDAPGWRDGSTRGDVNGLDGCTEPVPVALTFDGSKYVGTVKLRAERDLLGPGRVYTIICDAMNASGETTTTSCVVVVPKGLD